VASLYVSCAVFLVVPWGLLCLGSAPGARPHLLAEGAFVSGFVDVVDVLVKQADDGLNHWG
jgi:hypothetical protein